MSFVNVYEFVCAAFPFGVEGGMWDLIVLLPDHYLSIYFTVGKSYAAETIIFL